MPSGSPCWLRLCPHCWGAVEGAHRIWELLDGTTTEVALSTLFVLEFVAVLTVPSLLLKRRGRPTSALTWLLVLFALPAGGVLAWWLVGRTRIERRLRAHEGNKQHVAEQIGFPATVRGTRFDALLPGRARGEYAFSTSGNRAQLLPSGAHAFRAMEEELSRAQRCANLLFYIFKLDETGERFCKQLEACAKKGVEVRLLLDGFGCRKTIRDLKKRLGPHGVRIGVFFPARFWPFTPRLNFVNHRKLLTVDNHIAFTGGMNVGNEYEHEWLDLMVKVEGPCVEGLNHVFLEDWYFATREALSDPQTPRELRGDNVCDAGLVSSGPDTEDWIHDAYFLAVTQANERLYLSTPYFIPTAALLTALRTASGRGVDVRLVLPALSDVRLVMWASRSFYRPLIESGVRIYEYSGAMLHAKSLVMDDEVVCIGTANVDNRSFRLNFEMSLFLASARINDEVTQWLEHLFATSEEITSARLDEKSTPRKLLESAAHLLSPLL